MHIGNKAIVCALSASYISTIAGYPVRLHPSLESILTAIASVGLAQIEVADHEDASFCSEVSRVSVSGGRSQRILPRLVDPPCHNFIRPWVLPYLTIHLLAEHFEGAASFTIYSDTKEYCRNHDYFSRNGISDAALAGGISGALSGSLISFGSARAYVVPLDCLC